MSLDLDVLAALRSSVEANGQGEECYTRLVAWLESLSNGQTTLRSAEEVAQRLDLLLKVLVPPTVRE